MTKPKYAISYVRYSTGSQRLGFSEDRQVEAAVQWVKANGYELLGDIVYDRGKSGYYNTNLTEGSLGSLLDRIRNNDIPDGTVLILESMDRLSRAESTTVIQLILDIVNAGMGIVLLDCIYTGVIDKTRLNSSFESGSIWGILNFGIQRARGESHRKSTLILASRKRERERAKEGNGLISGVVPSWLHVDRTTNKLIVKEYEAGIIKLIFKMYTEEEKGIYTIHKYLQDNIGKYPPFGRNKTKWHKSYITKILNNPAVYGECIPYEGRGKDRKPLEPIQNYFPIIIDKSVFLKARYIAHQKKTSQSIISGKDREWRGRRGSVSSLITGLVYCGSCGDSLELKNKGYGQNLYCNNCKYKLNYGPYKDRQYFEIQFLKYLRHFDFTAIIQNDKNQKTIHDLTSKIAELQTSKFSTENHIARLSTKIRLCEEDLDETIFLLLKKEYTEKNIELKKYDNEIQQAEILLENLQNSPLINTQDSIKELQEKLYSSNNNEDKQRIREMLKNEIYRVIQRINILPIKRGVNHGFARVIYTTQEEANAERQLITLSWRYFDHCKPKNLI